MSAHPKTAGKGSPAEQRFPAPQAQNRRRELRADFLLNFQRPPAHQRPHNYAPPQRSRQSGKQQSAPVPFAKGRFVQSSFRLLVEDVTPDVVEAAFNADALLDWASIRRIDFMCEEHPKCPVCLEADMVVPKITRCGHIYCAPCIMRYFMTFGYQNGNYWQKCPICNALVSPEELISVKIEVAKALRDNDRATFVLAHRAINSTIVRSAPVSSSGSRAGSSVRAADSSVDPLGLPFEGDTGWRFSRVVKLAPGETGRMLAREHDVLVHFRETCIVEGDTELLPSIDAACEILARLQRELGTGGEQAQDSMLPPAAVDVPGEAEGGGQHEKEGEAVQGRGDEDAGPAGGPLRKGSFASARSSPAQKVVEAPTSPASGLTSVVSTPGMGPAASASTPTASNHNISFYQAADGRLVFLQPFFTRLLLHEHAGVWANLPATLEGIRVERYHEVSFSEEIRKRHKFLSHLPLTAQVSFAEVDLRSHLSQETKDYFADEFLKRRQQRKKDQIRSKKEDQRSKTRAAQEEERYYQSLNLARAPVQQVPTQEDFAPLPGRSSAGAEVAVSSTDEPRPEGGTSEGGAGEGAGDQEEEETGPTLADKIKEKIAAKASPGESSHFPTLGGDGQSAGRGATSSAAAASSSAWGPNCGSSRVARKEGDADAAAHAGGDVPSTPMDEEPTFGEALEAALRSAAHANPRGDTQGAQADQADAGGGTGKKKKGRAAKATTIRLFG